MILLQAITFSQVLVGVAVLLIAAGVGGGIVMYGTVQRIDERTKQLPDLARDVSTLKQDMSAVKTCLDLEATEQDEGEATPTADGGRSD